MKRITLGEAIDILKKNNQPDLLKDYDSLSPGERVKLLHQIADVDWDVIEKVKQGIKKAPMGNLTPPKACELKDIEENRDEFKRHGEFLLHAGKVGVVLLAGGLGTRLGLGKPKGEMNVGIKRVLYVYECLINNLLDVVSSVRTPVPLYIMTNDDYRESSEEFFKAHKYFGYPPEMITFFVQENNCCVDLSGNLFFDKPGHLACSPDGNGGWFKSMEKADLLVDLSRRGIEWLNVFSVDNVLQRMADPVFLGAVDLGGHDSGAKAVKKTNIFEKVGLFCEQDGRPAVVEYYEMDDVTKAAKDENGELAFRFGVTLNYVFSVKKLKEVLDAKFPVHFAKKKIPYMNEEGEMVEPSEPNGYKFETLAADMVAMMDDCLCFEIIRAREFAPIKNATGPDSIETARQLLIENGVKL